MDQQEMETLLLDMKKTQERHSERLQKVEGKLLNDWTSINSMNRDMEDMKKRMEKMEISQRLGERRTLKYQRWTIALLVVLVGMFGYLAVKDPSTAKDVATIAATGVTKAL